MKTKGVLSFCLAGLLAPNSFGFSSDGSLLSRSFDRTSVLTNSVIVVSAGFTNTEAASLRGFYYTDQVPSGLAVATLGVVLNGQSVTNYTVEVGVDSVVYPGCTPYRWVLEQSTNFAQANPIPPGAGLQIVYSISSEVPGVFNFQQFGWAGFDPIATNTAFGYSESADQVAVSFLSQTHNAFRITPGGSPTAGSPYALTITAVDQYQNTVTNVAGDHSFTFAGLAVADDGTYPTITDKTGASVNLETATTITFTNGVSSAGGKLLAYKAQTATLTGSDATSGKGTSDTGGTGANLTIANLAPVGGAHHFLGATVSTPLAVSVSTLANLDYDANHDLLTITAVSPTSTNGPANNVSLAAGTITYTPATGFVGADQFTYTISDGYGGTATSMAEVTVRLGTATSTFNYISPPDSNGNVTLRSYGIPGHSYDVQRSTDLLTWTTISGATGVTAAANALILYTDNPGSGTAFYRFAVHPAP